ncbi:hypothetical protein UCRPC4_g04084 [Phaeomoniella chlamydospora]|uniref:Uncharacterized protein n=1 Tax=Phaeomoniella chlamydospora TaxID=158046 RepID=A0A0G2EEW9_PHACM|nr:hypothetical protein UCRPC4_g04084 [Phaeomoniella chlamydospora]
MNVSNLIVTPPPPPTTTTHSSAPREITYYNYSVGDEINDNIMSSGTRTETYDIDSMIESASETSPSASMSPLPPCVLNMLNAAEYLLGNAFDNLWLLEAEDECQEAVYAQCFEKRTSAEDPYASNIYFNIDLWRSFILRLRNIFQSLKRGSCDACLVLLRSVWWWLRSSQDLQDATANLDPFRIYPSYITLAMDIQQRANVVAMKTNEIRERIEKYQLPDLKRMQEDMELNRRIRNQLSTSCVQVETMGEDRDACIGNDDSGIDMSYAYYGGVHEDNVMDGNEQQSEEIMIMMADEDHDQNMNKNKDISLTTTSTISVIQADVDVKTDPDFNPSDTDSDDYSDDDDDDTESTTTQSTTTTSGVELSYRVGPIIDADGFEQPQLHFPDIWEDMINWDA